MAFLCHQWCHKFVILVGLIELLHSIESAAVEAFDAGIWYFSYGIKLSKNNIGHEGSIYTFPYFCAFLLKRFMADFHAEEETE